MAIRKGPLLALILVLLLVSGGYLGYQCADMRAMAERQPLPAIIVEASYPGAPAAAVANAVADPIEQQVNGVERMVSMHSHVGNDGSYTLTVTFQRGADLNMARALVQNRVALATPLLPAIVQRGGITVRAEKP